MNNTKQRLITLLLALVMIFTSVPLNAFAASEANSGRKEITDIKTVGDKEIINLGEVKGQKSQLRFFSGRQRLYGARTQQAGNSSETVAQKVEINLDTLGLNLGDNEFDPSALTEVGSFDVKIIFKELGGRTEARTMFFQVGETTKTETFYLPKDFGNGFVDAEIPKLKTTIALRVYDGATGTTNFNLGQDMTYTFELTQIIHPVIDLKVVDPYGKELQENINQALGLKLTLQDEHDFTLAANTKTFNIRTLADFAGDNIAELNEVGANPTLSLTTQLDANKRLTVDSKTYKLNKITYNALGQEVEINGQKQKVGGYIEFATQPKIIVPTPDDNGNLPKTPDGYKRLSFHAESSPNAQDGRFKNGEKLKVIDVLEGTEYTDQDLQKQIKEIGQPTPIINGRVDDNKKFLKWKPELPTTGPVADTDYYPVYLANGDKITPGEKLPDGVFEVKVVKDDTIAADVLYGKTYAVFDGSTLARDKFPDLVAAVGHQNPKWTTEAEAPAKGMVDIAKPWTKEITKATTFKATAAEDAATQIKKEGLKAVDTTALQGQDLTEAFWHKGVALADNIPADKKAAFEALLKDATVTDKSSRNADTAGTFVGTLLVTFKDGSTLEVPNQKLIVKPNTVTIAFDKAEGKENPLRDGDTTVKGKITASSNSDQFPVSLDGALVTIKKGDTVLSRTLANADGSFVAGVKEPLVAGEDISVVVTLPESKTESAAVTEKVQLNPDKLNSIIPTGKEVFKNFDGKKGVNQDLVKALKAALDEADKLVDASGKVKSTVTVDATGQKSLDDQYEAIKKAIAALTENKIPEIKAPAYKEIFVGDEINLDDGVTVTDDNIKKVNGKDYSYTIYDGSDKETTVDAMKAKDGTYRVVYKAEDTQGVTAEHTMTVVVKKTVVEVPGEFPDPIPEGYVKVEFKSGKHAGLNGVSKFLVKKDSPKSEVAEPKIIPMEGYKVAEPKWSVAIPETFATDFETTAQVLAKVTTYKPADKDMDKYATLTFKAGDHGEFEQNAKTTIYVLKNEKVQFNAPKVNANEGFTFAKWDPELQESYAKDTKHVAQYASNSDISDTEVKGFQEVKFVAGDDGHFGNNVKEKSVWVRPGKLVDLRTKAPEVTVTTTGKSFVGWDQDLIQTFTKAEQATVINAKYDDTVKTTEPTENKESYAKVNFVAGNLGTIADDATKTYWVVKDAEVTLTPPAVTAKNGWKVNSEKPWDPAVATKYTKDTIHLAQYDYSGASVVPQKPGDEKPLVPDNFVKVEFKKGDHGVISSEENFIYWVDPTKPVTADFKAPKVIADTNYKHIGWKPALTANQTFDKATDIVAQYKSTVVTEDPNDANYVIVEFDAKDHGTLTGDSKFWVYKDEKVSITDPTVTAKEGYTFNKWDPAVKDSYAEATVHNATYTTNNNVSDTPVEGYNKVTFKAGDHGTLTEKSVWVKPDTLVDLTDKAPTVKANNGYSHSGWEPGLVGKFENNTDIIAQYTEEQTPEPNVIARNIGTEGPDGKRVPATKTTVEIETVPKAKVTIEYTDKDGQPQKIENLTAGEDGNLTKEIEPKLKDGTDVKVTVQDGDKKPADKTVKVFDDLDNNKISDNQAGKTERPAALASNIGKAPKFTTITGEAEKGATVTAKVGTQVVGTATADSITGKYTIQAKQNNAPIQEGIKIDVTATLAPKTESLKQTVVVFNDTDGTGQPDSAKDFDVKKATGMQVVASPDKMVYSDGDKLNLDGLKVLLKDVNGNQKIFTYNSKNNKEFTDAGLSVDYKQNDKLTNDDNGKKLTVTLDTKGNNEVTKAITGETPTALTVNKNQSAQPVDVVAANQGDDKVTKVKGKATKGADIKITDADGNSLLPTGTTLKAGDDGVFETKLNNLLDPGTRVFVTATEPGKSESPKAETPVIRDKDGNWEADTGAKLSTPVIDPIREKDEKIVVAAPAAKDKIQTIEVSDQNGKTVTLTKDPADKTGKTWKVDGSNDTVKENNDGKLEIPVKDKLPLNDRDQIKVTFKDGENPANEAFDKAPVQKASQTPTVDPVYTGDKNVKIVDPTVADPTAKTIKVKVGENDTMVIEKQADNSWKVKNNPNAKVEVKDGKVVVPLEDKAKKDDVIKVSTINDSKVESPQAEVTVIDKEKSTTPTVNPVATNDTKITGKAGPNADVVITITPKDGGTPKEIVTKADKDGNFTVPADGLKDGDTIVAKATEKDKAPAESAPVTVGVDTTGLDKAIQDGKDALDPEKGGKNNGTPADKKLEEAIKEGEDLKKRDPAPTQKELDDAKDKIEKAIEEKKETDKALDELKKAKDELDKTIEDAEADEKPDEAIEKGQDASDTAGGVIKSKGKDADGKDMTSKQINDLVEKTKEENRLLRLPVIQVAITNAVNNGKSVVFTTNPGRCKAIITVIRKDLSIENYEAETGPGGTGSLTLKNPLKSGDSVKVKVTRITEERPIPDYLDNYTSKIV